MISALKRTLLLGYGILLFLHPSNAAAQEQDLKSNKASNISIFDMLDMDLEELMEINVVRIVDADENLKTGNTYSFTEQDIIANGYYNLTDILEDVPSMGIINQDFFLTGETRGISGKFQEILLLVNGRKMQSLYNAQAFINQQFATHNIIRIDVTVGPQSVTYGSGAYVGTINITTKTASKTYNKTEVHVDWGTQNTQAASIVLGKKFGKIQLNGSIRLHNSNGWDYSNFLTHEQGFAEGLPAFANGGRAPTDTTSLPYLNTTKTQPFSLSLKYSHFYAGVEHYTLESGNKGISYINLLNQNANADHRTYGLYYAGWKQKILGKHILEVEYQHYREKIWGNLARYDLNPTYFDLLTSQRAIGESLELEEIQPHLTASYGAANGATSTRHRLHVGWKTFLSDGFNIQAGYFVEWNNLQNYQLAYKYPLQELPDGQSLVNLPTFAYQKNALFAQVKRNFWKNKAFLILGARFEHSTNYGSIWALKGGLILQPKLHTYVKLFFSQGFRQPTIFELDRKNLEATTQTLRPNLLNNLELNVLQRINRVLRFSLSLYQATEHHKIVSVADSLWDNQPTTNTIRGLEANLWYKRRRLEAKLGYSYTHHNQQLNLYTHRTFLGASYKLFPFLRVNTRVNFYPGASYMHGNPEIDANISFPSHIRLNFTVYSKEFTYQDMSIQLMATVKNLLDTKFYQPNITQTGPKQFLQPGRQIIGRVIFKYN